MPTRPMQPRRVQALILAALLAALSGAGCGSKSSPTSPTYGGGGGGGGTTFNLGPFAQGQSLEFTFPTAGTFGYHCNAHASMGMTGTVQVDASGADSLVVQVGAGGGFSFAPSTAHIKPAAYVRWVNVSGLTNHTVTSN